MRNGKDGFVLAFCLTIAAFGSSACEPDVSGLFAFRGAPVMEDMTIRTADGRSFRGEAATIEMPSASNCGIASFSDWICFPQ